MASLLIKIGDGPNYKDGDILFAVNRRRIRCVHAEHICHIKRAGVTREGLRPANALARWFREHTHQFQFQRVSRTVIERKNLWTGEREWYGPESIDVPLFVARRLRHERHVIFGESGREFWFGGRKDFSHAALDKVWHEIESRTNERETSYTQWPFTPHELRTFRAITVNDFDDATSSELMAPIREGSTLVKRKYRVNWRLLPGINEAAALDTRVLVNPRGRIYDWREIVEYKQESVREVPTHAYSA